jgi:hypothetical protein
MNTRKLPLLDDIRIATPCSESWDGMVGTEQVRFCGGCMKNVYNLSAMTRDEAEAVIREKEGDLCARLYRRKDGTVITADCTVGIRRRRITRLAAAALAFGGAGVAFASMSTGTEPCDFPPVGETSKPARTKKHELNSPSIWERLLGGEEPEPQMGDIQQVMGSAEPVAPPADVVPLMGAAAPPPPHRMGKIASPTERPEDDKVPTL